jgi:starch synthase
MSATETSVTGEMAAWQLAGRGRDLASWAPPPRSRILFAVAEAVPFAKVGGLADVGGALPRALADRGHSVRLVLPGYPCVDLGELVDSLEVALGGVPERVDVYACGTHQGVDVYALANGTHFDREMIYGYEDDVARFTLFSKAAARFAATSGWPPDIVHANDWHTGLLPDYARRAPYRAGLGGAATIFTIHNLAHQGPVAANDRPLIGIDGLRDSLIAQGIASADAVSTVSHKYLAEILTPEYGEGLDQLLRSRRDRLTGILNGIEYEEFDPGIDPHIPARYGPSSLERKALDKRALQQRGGLTVDPDVPLLGMVARLVDQKGLDLLCASLKRVVDLRTQVAVMGVGETRYRRALEEAAGSSSDSIAYFPTSRDELARLVYAGSDLFLAPSNYEPCGLGPLIALRYASIPIVRRTGGMAETIPDFMRDSLNGLGFTFIPRSEEHLVGAVKTAADVYADKERWRELQRRAMAADFSWARSAAEYEQMYRDAALLRRTHAGALPGR